MSLITISLGAVLALFSVHSTWSKKSSDGSAITFESSKGGENLKGSAKFETVCLAVGVFLVIVGFIASWAELVYTAALPVV